MKQPPQSPCDAGRWSRPTVFRRFLVPVLVSLCGACALPAATLAFVRVTENGPVDQSDNLYLEVTDLGGGLVLFALDHGTQYEGFIRNVWVEDRADSLATLTFATEYSDPGVVFEGPSKPALPPGLRPFVADYSFQADKPGAKKGIEDGELGSFVGTYVGSYAEFEQALATGGLRVAIHLQGIAGGYSDTYVSGIPVNPIPEPSGVVLLGLASVAGLWRRVRR